MNEPPTCFKLKKQGEEVRVLEPKIIEMKKG